MGNAKQAWDGLNTMMGRETRKPMYHSQGVFFAENLNVFFSRFDRGTCTTECDRICRDIPTYENIILKEHETAASLACIKPNKAPGPDGLKGRVIKDCAFQLTGVLTKLFQLLLNEKVVPSSWKLSNIIPVPKISNANQSKDFRPIALTSILGKCMERVLSTYIKNDVNKYLDPLQFAYKTARGTDDATLTLCNLVSEHIQQTSNYARILFIDFSSAFNSIKIDVLLQRLLDLRVNGGLIWWIRDFLLNRPQRVVLNDKVSKTIVLNSGVPQGTILSPLLFSLYINDFKIHNSYFSLLKYADDLALVGLLYKGGTEREKLYHNYINSIQKWCKLSALEINLHKTKELVMHLR